MTSKFGKNQDIFFMKLALKEAGKAFDKNEVPVGAVIVDADGKIIGKGYNLVETKYSQYAHAEMLALERAGKKRGGWRLENCWLYVTLEPCIMCIGLAVLSRIEGIIYGAPSLLFGYNFNIDDLRKKTSFRKLLLVHNVCSEDAITLMQKFFKNKRIKGKRDRK